MRPDEPNLWASGRIGRNDWGGLGQAVPLEHGDSDGVEEALEFDVEKRSAADEKLETAAEIFADFFKDQGVVKRQERAF